MKYPTRLGTAAFAAALFLLLLPNPVQARIGETKQTIESRLFGSGGITYRDDATEANRRRGMAYVDYLNFFPGSVDLRIYFKTSDGHRPSSSELEERRMPEGWDLHVVYVSGKSAIEVYKRSQPMTIFEFNHLLALHSGGGYWKRLSKEEQAEAVSAFQFDMVRSDGAVRAKRLGRDGLMFFDAEMDAKLAVMNTSDQQEKAPVSVDGF